ncbi:unnamed protein product [Staurois parvus]|uniref:Uncharacterized protein n=1 Tax=Staurois parvus TaxID=386267 RepID=A0ABN9FK89_9NEOB|nr:unnamed protein product [Staurois parvus]
MTLRRKGLTSGAIKGLAVCCFAMLSVCVLYYVSMLLCIILLCRTIQRSMLVLTRKRSVLFIYRPLPCQCSLAITGCR